MHIVAVDQGTTNTKAVLCDERGDVLVSASRPVNVAFPQPGWVESDAIAIWRSVIDAMGEVTASLPPRAVDAVAIANQRESVVVWDRASGAPLGPVVSWQCRRGVEVCKRPHLQAAADLVTTRTGLTLDPMFSASKLVWLLEHIDQGRERAGRGELCAGTVDSWLVYCLTGGRTFTTDLTNASRTLLLDLDQGLWDGELLELFGIPRACLPAIAASSASVGTCGGNGGDDLPAAIVAATIAGVAGDSHAALVGHHATRPGTVKATFGTGSSVMAVTPSRATATGLSSTIAWSAATGTESGPRRITHALEGNIYATGAALDWTASLLDTPGVGALEALARQCSSTDGVTFVPAFSGLGAPHWDPGAVGLVTGLTRGTSRAQVARAAFEAVAHQVADVLDVMHPPLGGDLKTLVVDGGASRSGLLLGLVADVTGITVQRPDVDEVACRGAALLASHALGAQPAIDELAPLPASDEHHPSLSPAARAAARAAWAREVRRARVAP